MCLELLLYKNINILRTVFFYKLITIRFVIIACLKSIK